MQIRKGLPCVLMILLIIGSCSPKKEEVTLQKNTPAYQLAKDLAAIIPALDPDANQVMVSAKSFNLTTGEVIQFMMTNLGSRVEQLKTLDPSTLLQYIERNAQVLADRKLIMTEAAKSTISVAKEDIDKAFNMNAQNAGGAEKYQEFLEANGTSVDDVKKSIESDLLMQNFLDSIIAANVTVTDDELQTTYGLDKSASVRHILLLTENKTDEEKAAIRKQMEDILARAKAGEDFADLAREFTEDPGSKENGGLYEDFTRGTMVEQFEDAAFNLPIGSISDLVETRYGYHILQIVDRKRETRPFEEVREELQEQLRQQKTGQAFVAYMDDLRQKSDVKVNPLQ